MHNKIQTILINWLADATCNEVTERYIKRWISLYSSHYRALVDKLIKEGFRCG